MPFSVCLPFAFDPGSLKADLDKVRPDEWVAHYRPQEYKGDWAVAPLRAVGGHPAVVHAVPGARKEGFFKPTPLLERSPAFQDVLGRFACQIGAARLLRLGPGAKILEHRDDMGDDETEEWRIHVPVQTNKDVQFWVAGQLVPMRPGEVWYADFNQPHRVDNNGDTDRVHLVLDCEPNGWLREQVEKSILIAKITAFLNEIGIHCHLERLDDPTFLPGLGIRGGEIVIDAERLLYPGDILHEAGHIAVTPAAERSKLYGNVGENNPNAMGQEIVAILWSFAALRAIGLPSKTVFHPDGYKGQSDWFIENFETGTYMGLPLLEWMGLCLDPKKAQEKGAMAFPNMLRWLRE